MITQFWMNFVLSRFGKEFRVYLKEFTYNNFQRKRRLNLWKIIHVRIVYGKVHSKSSFPISGKTKNHKKLNKSNNCWEQETIRKQFSSEVEQTTRSTKFVNLPPWENFLCLFIFCWKGSYLNWNLHDNKIQISLWAFSSFFGSIDTVLGFFLASSYQCVSCSSPASSYTFNQISRSNSSSSFLLIIVFVSLLLNPTSVEYVFILWCRLVGKYSIGQIFFRTSERTRLEEPSNCDGRNNQNNTTEVPLSHNLETEIISTYFIGKFEHVI